VRPSSGDLTQRTSSSSLLRHCRLNSRISDTTSSNSFGVSMFRSFCVITGGFSPICLLANCGLSWAFRIRFSHLKTSSNFRLLQCGSQHSVKLLRTATQNSREFMYGFFFILSRKSFRNFSNERLTSLLDGPTLVVRSLIYHRLLEKEGHELDEIELIDRQ